MDFKSEFRPPDDEMVDFILGLGTALEDLSTSSRLTEEEQQTLNVAHHNLKLLLAMTLSGYTLYITESNHADELAELAEGMRQTLKAVSPLDELATDLTALKKFSDWRSTGLEGDTPLFDGF